MSDKWILDWEKCKESYEAYEIWEKHWLEENPKDKELDIFELIDKYGKDERIKK